MCTYPVLDTVTDAGGIAFSRKKIPLSPCFLFGVLEKQIHIFQIKISQTKIFDL